MKLNVQHKYESEMKKSNKAFIIIQNYSTCCQLPDGFELETAAKKDIIAKQTAL